MYRKYEHTIVITNRALVQGDFFEQMQKGDLSASACSDFKRKGSAG